MIILNLKFTIFFFFLSTWIYIWISDESFQFSVFLLELKVMMMFPRFSFVLSQTLVEWGRKTSWDLPQFFGLLSQKKCWLQITFILMRSRGHCRIRFWIFNGKLPRSAGQKKKSNFWESLKAQEDIIMTIGTFTELIKTLQLIYAESTCKWNSKLSSAKIKKYCSLIYPQMMTLHIIVIIIIFRKEIS